MDFAHTNTPEDALTCAQMALAGEESEVAEEPQTEPVEAVEAEIKKNLEQAQDELWPQSQSSETSPSDDSEESSESSTDDTDGE